MAPNLRVRRIAARMARSDRQTEGRMQNQKPAADTASPALSYKPLRGFDVPYSPRRRADQQDHHRHRRIAFPRLTPRGGSAAARRRERGNGAGVALIEEGWWTNGRAQQG